jgi:molybdopterin converting factor subunit 1
MAQILYFGRLVDVTHTPDETLDIPTGISTTTQLRAWLDARLNTAGALLEPTVRLAVNNEIVKDPHPITNQDEIAFMPPVGGG